MVDWSMYTIVHCYCLLAIACSTVYSIQTLLILNTNIVYLEFGININSTSNVNGGSGFKTSSIAVVATILEKSVFYYCDEHLTAPSVSLGLPKQFVTLSAQLNLNIASLH